MTYFNPVFTNYTPRPTGKVLPRRQGQLPEDALDHEVEFTDRVTLSDDDHHQGGQNPHDQHQDHPPEETPANDKDRPSLDLTA